MNKPELKGMDTDPKHLGVRGWVCGCVGRGGGEEWHA